MKKVLFVIESIIFNFYFKIKQLRKLRKCHCFTVELVDNQIL